MLQHLLSLYIGEVNILEVQVALYVFDLERLVSTLILRLAVHYVEYALSACKRGLYLRILVCDFVYGSCELLGIGYECLNCSYRDIEHIGFRPGSKNRSHNGDKKESEVADRVHARSHYASEYLRLDSDCFQLIAGLVEILADLAFVRERLDRLAAADSFFDLTIELTELSLL